jgi:coproporphyrinogen III oxidase-like Fe-S oxidoreductase
MGLQQSYRLVSISRNFATGKGLKPSLSINFLKEDKFMSKLCPYCDCEVLTSEDTDDDDLIGMCPECDFG